MAAVAWMTVIAGSFLLFLFTFSVYKLFLKRNLNERRNGSKTVSLMIIAGSGGHTAEILRLTSGLDLHRYIPRIYVVAQSDDTSIRAIRKFESERLQLSNLNGEILEDTLGPVQSHKNNENVYMVVTIPRSREVHQAWSSTIITTFLSLMASVPIVFKYKPELIVCNGPGTCVPICVTAIILRVLKLISVKIVYVESICRVYDLSLSGKILYRLVDRTIVQWPELNVKYPTTTIYVGRLS